MQQECLEYRLCQWQRLVETHPDWSRRKQFQLSAEQKQIQHSRCSQISAESPRYGNSFGLCGRWA